MKKVFYFTIALFLCTIITSAQTYNKVKITTKDGRIIDGTKGSLEKESFSFKMNNASDDSQSLQTSVPLSEVSMIQAKKGKAGKWALGCGGGCLALCLVTTLADNGQTADTGTMLLGSALWTVVFAGVGAIIGSSSDHWEIIYSKNTSMLKNLNLNFTTDQFTRHTPRTNNLTLSYRF